jgi:hypothetical protein
MGMISGQMALIFIAVMVVHNMFLTNFKPQIFQPQNVFQDILGKRGYKSEQEELLLTL